MLDVTTSDPNGYLNAIFLKLEICLLFVSFSSSNERNVLKVSVSFSQKLSSFSYNKACYDSKVQGRQHEMIVDTFYFFQFYWH